MENERGAAKWHIASVSWGKDSLAMLLLLIEKSWPLDEVVFYDTGMEFQAIYDTQDRMLPELERLGIKYTRLEPENPFLFDMLERPVQSRQKGAHRGYGWVRRSILGLQRTKRRAWQKRKSHTSCIRWRSGA